MDRNIFNEKIRKYVADSKVKNRDEIENIFKTIKQIFEEENIKFSERLIDRIKDEILEEHVKELNNKLDNSTFGFVLDLGKINDANALNNDLNTYDFSALRRQAERIVEDTVNNIFRNTFGRVFRYAEMDNVRINEEEVRSIIKVTSDKAGNKIVDEVLTKSFNRLINELKDMVKDDVKEETKEEVKDNSKEFYAVDKHVDELGTTVKPAKPKYDLRHFSKERILDGKEIEMSTVPEDFETVNFGNNSCFLISPNDITKIYYYDETLKDKCRLVEDPADYVTAAKIVKESDFYKSFKFSAEYDSDLKAVLDEFDNKIKEEEYNRGMRDLMGEERYEYIKAKLKQQEEQKSEMSDNEKAFL